MFVSCIVPFCFTGLDLQDTTVLYPLPNSFDLRRKWFTALGLSENAADASPNTAVCSKHLNIPAFAICISEAEGNQHPQIPHTNVLILEDFTEAMKSSANSHISVAKLVQKQIHDKLSWKHRKQFGQATVTPKSLKPADKKTPDVAFVDCHILQAPNTISTMDEVIIPDDVPFVPKPSTAATGKVQDNRNLKALKLMSTLQKLPNLLIRKPLTWSGQGKGNVPAADSIKKTTLALCKSKAVPYPTHPIIATSKKKTHRMTEHFPSPFNIVRQGKKISYAVSKRPASHYSTSPTPTSLTQPSQTKINQTTTRTYARQSPPSQTLSKPTPECKTRAIEAPGAQKQTSQAPTTPTIQSVYKTSIGLTPTSQSRNNQTPGSKTQVILGPTAKTQAKQAPTIQIPGNTMPTNQTVSKTSTGRIPTSQTHKATGSKPAVFQAPIAKMLASQAPKFTIQGSTTLTNQTVSRTSTGPIPTRQSHNITAPGSKTRAILAPAANTQATTQILCSKTPTNQTAIRTYPGPTPTHQTFIKTFTGPTPSSQTLVRKPSAPTQTSQIHNTQALGSKTQSILAPTVKTQDKEAQTTQMESKAPTNRISLAPDNQTPAGKARAIKVPPVKTLEIKVPTNQSLGNMTRPSQAPTTQTLISKTPTYRAVTVTSTGPACQTSCNQTSVSKTSTSQTLIRTSTAKTLSPVYKSPSSHIIKYKMPASHALTGTVTSQATSRTNQKTQNPTNQASESKILNNNPSSKAMTFGKKLIELQKKCDLTTSNQTPGGKVQAIQASRPLQTTTARMQTSKSPTIQALKTPTFQTVTTTSTGPTSQTHSNQTSVGKTPINQTPIRTSATKTPMPVFQSPNSQTIKYKTPSSHTLARTTTSQASSSTVQITQTPTTQSSESKIPASTSSQTSTNNAMTFGKKLIELQEKCGIVISKHGKPKLNSRSQTMGIGLRLLVKRPLVNTKPLQKKLVTKSSSSVFPAPAIGPPSSITTTTSSQIRIDENVQVNRNLEMRNDLIKQYKDQQLKHKQEFEDRLQKVPTQQLIPIPESQRLLDRPTETDIITIDEDDEPDFKIPTKPMNSLLPTGAIFPLLPMIAVPRSESLNPPKPPSRVEPYQLISVADLLSDSATIVIDDDDDPIVEILPNGQITNNEANALPVVAKVAKESSDMITLSEKPTYSEDLLDGNTCKIQNKVAKLISIDDPPTIHCDEGAVESSSDPVKVAVSAIRLDVANKIADVLDKLLNTFGESVEGSSSEDKSKKKRTKFQCDNCLLIFDRLYKIKRHIFLSSVDPSECMQEQAPPIDSTVTVGENPIIGSQANQDKPDECGKLKVVSSKEIAITALPNHAENEEIKTMSTKNIQDPKVTSQSQAQITKETATVPNRPKMEARKITTKAVKPTVMKRKYTKRKAKTAHIITPIICNEEKYDSDVSTISVTSNSPFTDLDVPRIELLNEDGHAMADIPQYNPSINLDFEQWINSLAPNTEVQGANQTHITPAIKQTKRRRTKPLYPRARRLRNEQKNKKAAVLQTASDSRASNPKTSNAEPAKQIPYNSRRRNTRSAASLMVELPNPSYQHSSAEPSDRRASKRKISSNAERTKQIPYNSSQRNTRLAASLPNSHTAEPQNKRKKRK